MVRCPVLRRLRSEHGMTMMEVIVVLAVLGIMAALLTPMVLNYVEDSKLSAAQGDVSTIAASVLKLTRDVGHFPLYKDGTKTTGDPDFDLLVSAGNDPIDGTGKWFTTGGSGEFPGQGQGNQGQFPGQGQGNQGQFPGQGPGGSTKTDGLENHLVKNSPGGTTDKRYATAGPRAWRGPYLERVAQDPWGNRYLVNIKNADPTDTSPNVVWVLSAGPNGKIETDPTTLADAGPIAGGDDITVRLK